MTNMLYTIGSNPKDAEDFFTSLESNAVSKVIDVRLNNNGQFSGFSKKNHIGFFLKRILGCEYLHLINLALTEELFNDYQHNLIDWPKYQESFNLFIHEREIEENLSPEGLHNACLLCSEAEPTTCHRRLVAEYLVEHFGDIEIKHL